MSKLIDIKIQKTPKSKLSSLDFHNIPFGKIYTDHLFTCDYINGSWQEPKIIPFGNVSMSPATAVLHYGQSIFEGLKAYKSESGNILVFRPLDNLERLNKSAERLCIPQVPKNLYVQGLTELLKLDADWIPCIQSASLYLRPVIYAYDEYIGIRPSNNYKFMIIGCPVGDYYSEPVKVKIETEYSRAFEGGTGYAKCSANYSSSYYPARLAQDKGYHQLLWTDGKTHQYIEESGTMNVFFVIDNKIITPAITDTILKGITRASVIKLAIDWGYEVEERKISVREVINAIKEGRLQEAFGAGTAATIAHIPLINYDNNDYLLPEIKKDAFSKKALVELEAIRRGNIEDRFNWLMKI